MQVFNFEDEFFIDNTLNNGYTSYKQPPLLIPGYHFNNKLAYHEEQIEDDYIQILMADGSLTTLVRDFAVSNGENEGVYVENDRNKIGFAIVKYYDLNNFLREMWYKPGDGLTYYFKEEFSNLDIVGSGSSDFDPKTMYLKKIFNNYNNYLSFEYSDLRIVANNGTPQSLKGRNNFIQLNLNTFNYKNLIAVTYNTYPNLSYSFMDCDIRNQSSGTTDWKLRVNFQIDGSNGTLGNRGRIGVIQRITNNLDQQDSLFYSFYERKYKHGNDFEITTATALPFDIKYRNGRKTNLKSYGKDFDTKGSVNPGFALDFKNESLYSFTNMNRAFRDCFTTFMLAERNLWDKEKQVFKEEYSYNFDNDPVIHYPYNDAIYDNINTTITKTNFLEDTTNHGKITTIKNFTKYRYGYVDTYAQDHASIIKIDSETISNGNDEARTEYIWKRGNLHDQDSDLRNNYYEGSFDLDDETIKEKINNISSTEIINYETFRNAIIINGRARYKIDSALATDAAGIKTKSNYVHFIPSGIDSDDFADTESLHLADLISYEKTYNGPLIKNEHSYEYYDLASVFAGKLKKELLNPSRKIETTYNYYHEAENENYFGFIKEKKVIDKKENIYLYSNQTTGQKPTQEFWVNGIIRFDDGTEEEDLFNFGSTAPFPAGKKLVYNTSDTLETYTQFRNEKVIESIGSNDYYSTISYENLGRIETVSFPGSFKTDGTQIIYDTTYGEQKIYTDNYYVKHSTGSISNNFNYIKYFYSTDQPNALNITNENWSDFYAFFEESFTKEQLESYDNSKVILYPSSYVLSSGQNFDFYIQFLLDEQGNITLGYDTLQFAEVNSLGGISLKTIYYNMNNIIEQMGITDTIFGIKLSTSIDPDNLVPDGNGFVYANKEFYFNPIPVISLLGNYVTEDTLWLSNNSVEVIYDDDNNKI